MSALADEVPAMTSETVHDVEGVIAHVTAFRNALVRADVKRVQALRWLAPRPPGERDLLSDMAVAEGLNPAIHKLSRFWQQASTSVERVRIVDEREAELYERVALPSESLPIVTVLRRESGGAPWKTVCTNEAYDERFVLWLPTCSTEVDDTRLTKALPSGTELLMDGDDGVLAHERWLVHVRGPVTPETWPDALPGETPRILELASALAPEPRERRAQLRWLFGCGLALLPELAGHALYLRREDRALMPQAVQKIVQGQATPEQAVRFWSRTELGEGCLHTDGLRLLGLPEIEAEETLLDEPDEMRRVIEWLASRVVKSEQLAHVGTEIAVRDRTLVVVGGRRGPKRGRSYGRCGAVRLVDVEGLNRRGSRSRMRVPEDT